MKTTIDIPADLTPEEAKAAREWATDYLKSGAGSERVRAAARVVLATVPAPPRPTLADMTWEERRACQWMQADVIGFRGKYILASLSDWDGDAVLLDREGAVYYEDHASVTPRPDLPRMTWPGAQEAEDMTPAKVGDVIESATDPRIAALPVGTVLLDRDGEATVKRNEVWNGPGYTPIPEEGDEFGPWTVERIDQEADQ